MPCLACAPKYKQKQIWRAHSASHHHHHQQQQLFIFYHLLSPIKLSRVCCSTAVCLFVCSSPSALWPPPPTALAQRGQSISKSSKSPRRLPDPPTTSTASVRPSVRPCFMPVCDCFSSGSFALPFLFSRASYLVRFAQSVYGVFCFLFPVWLFVFGLVCCLLSCQLLCTFRSSHPVCSFAWYGFLALDDLEWGWR